MNVGIRHPTDRPNFAIVDVGHLSVAFSYTTPIAYSIGWGTWVVRRNQWGPTTGRHLNLINDDHDIRIDGATFELQLAEVAP